MTGERVEKKPLNPYRWVSVVLRSIHIATMGVVLGGVFLGAGHEALSAFIWAVVLSGCLMLGLDVCKCPRVLLQLNGLAVLLKLLLLAAGVFVFPTQQFAWYLAATLVASVASHMPGHWRHYDILIGCLRKDS